MRNLGLNELSTVSGAAYNDGYNLSYVVNNTITWGIIGFAYDVCSQSHYAMNFAAVGCLVATAQVIAHIADEFYFNNPSVTTYNYLSL